MSEVTSPVRHNHNNPFNADCQACKLVCLACIGQSTELYIDREDGPVKIGVCTWCQGIGTREAYDEGNKRYQQRLDNGSKPPESRND